MIFREFEIAVSLQSEMKLLKKIVIGQTLRKESLEGYY